MPRRTTAPGRKQSGTKKHSTSAALSQKLKDIDSSGVEDAAVVAAGLKPTEEVGETGNVEEGDVDNAVAVDGDACPLGSMDLRKQQKPPGRARAKASTLKRNTKCASPTCPPASKDTGDKSSSSTATPAFAITAAVVDEAGAVPNIGLARDIGVVANEAATRGLPNARPSPHYSPGDSVPPIFLQGPGEQPQRLRLEDYKAPVIPENKSVKPNLRYFTFAGRAETSRLIAAVGGLEMDETPEVTDKAIFGFPGTLPRLDHGQVQITHSFAVELYVARIAPKFIILTEKQKAIDAMFCKMKEDMFKGFASILMDMLTDDTKKVTAVVDVAKVAEKWFPILEDRLPGSCGEFIHGLMFPTAADLAVLNVAIAFMPFGAAYDIGRYDVFNQHPKLAAHVDRVSRYPEVKAYLSRSKTIDCDPFNLRPPVAESDGSSESLDGDDELWGPDDITTMSRAMGYHQSTAADHESSKEDDEDCLSESSGDAPATLRTQTSLVEEHRLREEKQHLSHERAAARKDEKEKRDRAMKGSSRFGDRGRKNGDGRPRWKTLLGSMCRSAGSSGSWRPVIARKANHRRGSASEGHEALVHGHGRFERSGSTKPSSWSSSLSKAAGFFKRNKPDMKVDKGQPGYCQHAGQA